MRLLHISDLHFGRFFQSEAATAFAQCCRSLPHDALVVSGDLTHRARANEFKQAKEFLEQITDAPLIVVPGNHDIPLYRFWERLTAPRAAYTRHFPEALPKVCDVANVRIVALDSTDALRAKAGKISKAELACAISLFEARPDAQFRVLVMHHNLLTPPQLQRHKPIRDAERILDALAHARVNAVLCGHLHHGFIATWPQAGPADPTDHQLFICNCGTTTARRGQRGNDFSFNLLDFQAPAKVEIQCWHYTLASGAFECERRELMAT